VSNHLPKPINNCLLVEVSEEYSSVIRDDDTETKQRGKVLDYSFTPHHLTASAGYHINGATKEEISILVGKNVYWDEIAGSGQMFTKGDKKYAFIQWWRVLGFEE